MQKVIHIGLINQGGRGWIGGTEYFKNLILGVASLPPETRAGFRISLICPEPLELEICEQIRPHVQNIYYLDDVLNWPESIHKRIINKIHQQTYKHIDPRWTSFIKHAKLDFLYPLNSGLIGEPFPEEPFACRWAAWIPDFQHKYLAEFFPEAELVQRDEAYSLIAKFAPVVVVSSKAAESDFRRFYPESAHKTAVLPFRVSFDQCWLEGSPLAIQKKYCLPDKFFIISNQFWQHKNHSIVFEALQILQGQAIYPEVVLTGHLHDYRSPNYSDFILQAIHTRGISKQIYLLGLVPKSDQVQLMRRATAVIQPSLFEGWSTVVEDARNLGKPIILSDLPVHLEQAPGAAVYFDRYSAQELATCLAEVWKEMAPGPNQKEEQLARHGFKADVQTFASRFLQIVRTSSPKTVQ